jgi:hypothetical protein
MTAQRVRRDKAVLSSACEAHPANRSSRKQPISHVLKAFLRQPTSAADQG